MTVESEQTNFQEIPGQFRCSVVKLVIREQKPSAKIVFKQTKEREVIVFTTRRKTQS